jgi:hypothetical protein
LSEEFVWRKPPRSPDLSGFFSPPYLKPFSEIFSEIFSVVFSVVFSVIVDRYYSGRLSSAPSHCLWLHHFAAKTIMADPNAGPAHPPV